METTLESAASERAAFPKAGALAAFLALTVLFSLADAGSKGVLAATALAAVKPALILLFFPDAGA